MQEDDNAHGIVASSEDSSSTPSRTEGVTSSMKDSLVPEMAEHDLLPIDDQVQQVLQLSRGDWMKEGATGYVITTKWLNRVLAKSSSPAKPYSKEDRFDPIGPINNADIWLDIDVASSLQDESGAPFIFLKPDVTIEQDFEIVPESAWQLMLKWYGCAPGSPTITRFCHNTSLDVSQANLMFEIHPPIFTLLKVPVLSLVDAQKKTRPVQLLASRHERFNSFLKRAKERTSIELKTKVRLWRLLPDVADTQQTDNGDANPSNQILPWSASMKVLGTMDSHDDLVLDLQKFVELAIDTRRELIDAKDDTANPNYNGRSSLDLVGLRQNEVIVLEEMIGGPAGGEWVSDASTARRRAAANSRQIATTDALIKAPEADEAVGNSSTKGIMTRSRDAKLGKARGSVGLGNLGNTCYMNSALQCVRSVKELTLYFLDNKHKAELNPNNPLGNHGEVAKAYAKLLHEMYAIRGSSSFTPRVFKNVIGRYGPSFSGYQQQDSQEFLLFLLDGLQEDLNRIDKKPYIEKPDSTDEMVHDQLALRKMADTCWDIYRKRNDSVITDLFAGMYKSTLHCPVCSKVSIIFDPFNNLTLQLPIQNVWSKNVRVYLTGVRPFEMTVEVEKNATWSGVSEFIGRRVGTDATRLILAEQWHHKFYRLFEPRACVAEANVSDNDVLACYEIEARPTNFPAPKRATKSYMSYGQQDDIPEGDSPLADFMLVSVFHRRSKPSSSRGLSKEYFGDPALLVVTREEAKDHDAILKKCLSRVEALTTRDFLREEDLSVESDTVMVGQTDAVKDANVHAQSIESEEGLVSVSVTAEESSQRLIARRPAADMLRPGADISPGAQRLFHMKIMTSRDQMVPTGNQGVGTDATADLRPLMQNDETEQVVSTDETLASQDNAYHQRLAKMNATPPTSDEDEPEVSTSTAPPAEVDDSDGLPEIEQIIQPPIEDTENAGPVRRKGKALTYSYKDRRRMRQNTPKVDRQHDADRAKDGILLHLGESIVLDWTEQGFDAMFSGCGKVGVDDDRGQPTWSNLSAYEDQELEAKRRIRAQRRRTGFSLGDCLDEFRKPEILSENDAWYCPRCKEHRRASKTFELWKAPDILVIHLKRFSTQGRLNNKLDFMVDFPLEGLDLGSRLATDPDLGRSPIYELLAVDNHYGGLGGGHYTAYAKNFVDGNWYEYDDSLVRRKDAAAVVTSAAYLLFYRRISDKPLGGPAFQRPEQSSSIGSEAFGSRDPSPSAGDGQRLGDSSQHGSSSAFSELKADVPISPMKETITGQHNRSASNESTNFDSHSTNVMHRKPRSLNEDEDEGIGMEAEAEEVEEKEFPKHLPMNYHNAEPAWSFDAIERDRTHVNSDAEINSDCGNSILSDRESRMQQFSDVDPDPELMDIPPPLVVSDDSS